MIFFLLHVVLVILQSPLVADLLENHIDVASEGKKLRFKTILGGTMRSIRSLSSRLLLLWSSFRSGRVEKSHETQKGIEAEETCIFGSYRQRSRRS